MGRWFAEKLQQWLILVLGVVVIGGSIAIGALFQSTPGPAKSVEVAATTQNDSAKSATTPQAAPVPAPSPTANTAPKAAAAPAATAKVGSKTEAKAESKTAANAKANNAAAPAPQSAQAAPPMIHNHAAAAVAPTTGQSAQPAATPAALTGDAAAGRQVFRKCQACHSLDAGKNGLGPSLAGIVGEKAAAVAGYNFSPAMKASNLTWDEATLDAYLTDPQKVVPGNKMPFPGLKTERERSAVIAFLAANSKTGGSAATAAAPAGQKAAAAPAATPVPATATPPASAVPGSNYVPGLRYTLRSGIAEGRMVFIGVGGSIDGQVNPLLSAAEGQVVQITLINGEGAEHDIVFADQGPAGASSHIVGKGASTSIAFVASKAGDYLYYCSVPGHRLAGMEGKFLITPQPPPQTVVEADISQKPTDVPAPIGKRGPQTVRVDLVTVELEARLAGRHDVRLLDLQRQGAGSDAARPRRRYRRCASEECRRQFDAALGRLPRGDRPRRRRRIDPDQSGRREELQVQGADARAVRLSLRHADGRPSHRQRHVRNDSGRARRRPAAGRSRVLRDAGRDLHRWRIRPARQPGVQCRKAAERASGILRLQRIGRCAVQVPSDGGKGR